MKNDVQSLVQDLNARYVEAIDDDKLEKWPEFFRPDCRYKITTADNVAQGLPMGLVYATSQAMLRDRVKALRQANIYEAQRYRHLIAAPRLIGEEGGVIQARTNFIVARIMHTGETMLFATGYYDDRISIEAGQALFAEKTVILDSRQIDTLLAIPL